MDRSWVFDEIDSTKLKSIEKITEVSGSIADGYYFLNFPLFTDASTCMVPVSEDENFRLAGYTRDATGYDDSFVWHVTNNADGTLSISNCGIQDYSYIESITKGPKESPNVMMTGTDATKFRATFLSNGCVYLYTTDNDNNLAVDATSGNIVTKAAHNAASMIKFVPVPANEVTNEMKIQEALANARGRKFTVGTEPGQVSQADYDAFKAVLAEAETAYDTDEDHSAIIAKLNAATATLISQQVPMSEGYYRLRNYKTDGDVEDGYLKAYYKNGVYYLGWESTDPTLDPSAVWHVTKNADGNFVMKNCGTQDSTYIKSPSAGYNWCYVNLSGTSKTTQSFEHRYSNVFKLRSSDNNNPWNADSGNIVSANNDYHPTGTLWYVEKVTGDDVPFMTALNEAITDAGGTIKDSGVGPNPGQNKGDATALNELISQARTMYDEGTASDDEVKAMVEKLATARAEFAAQDHGVRGIEDGYYFFVNSPKAFQGGATRDYIAMFTSQDGYQKWAEIGRQDPRFIYEVKSLGDGNYSIRNLLYDRYISKKDETGGVTTTAEQTVAQTFYNNNGQWWNIKNTDDNTAYSMATYRTELSGAIEENNSGELRAWRLEKPVQSVVDSLLTAVKQQRTTEAMQMVLKDAEPVYKAVFKYTPDRSAGLITEVNESDPHKGQVWGTQEPSAAGSYSSYAQLIDGDLQTCFQSTWNKSNIPDGYNGGQVLQVDLRNNPVDNFEFYFGLRDGDWGYREFWTDIDIYTTNDATLADTESFDATEWNHVGHYTDMESYIRPKDFEKNGSGRTMYYDITGLDQQYRYIRFVVNKTAEPQAANMYTIGEFQVYALTPDEENSPYYYVDGLKDLVDKLKSEIDNAKAKIASNSVTEQEIADLKATMAEVAKLTPDAEPLAELIAEATAYVGKFSDTGAWGDVETDQMETMENALTEANEYDHDRPTVGDLDERMTNLTKALSTFKSQQKMPEAGKWYYIVNTDNSRRGYTAEGGTGSSIYDSWCTGNVIMAPHTNVSREARWSSGVDAVIWGGYDHATATRADSVYADPYAMWRLVPTDEEGAYALQNRATGFYIGVSANHYGRIGMTDTIAMPYKVTVVKSGQLQLTCLDKSNTDKRPLHASGDKYLVTWEGGTDSPSSWNLEPVVEDLEAMQLTVRNNAATILTLPYAYDEDIASFNADNGIKTYAIKGISADGTQLQLTEKNSFEAGEPMIVIAGDIANYSESATDSVRMYLPLAETFTSEVKEANGIVGTLNYVKNEQSVGFIKGNTVVSSEGKATGVIGQRGWIDAAKIVNNDALSTDATLAVSGIINGVSATKTAVKATGKVDVYTIDGALVKRGVKAGEATKGLRRGIYIVGKQKVLVK